MEDVADEANDFNAPKKTDNAIKSSPSNLGESADVSDTCEDTEYFMGLCRTCGKPNPELHELFPEFTGATNTANDTSSAASRSLPPCRKVIVPAKATAKCQIDIDCILVEMEIWDLGIRANDGLPYRICPQCVRQFYIISKFRSKCIKVQQRLRGYYAKCPAAAADEAKLEEMKLTAEAAPVLDIGNNFINHTDEQILPEAEHSEAAPCNAGGVAASLLDRANNDSKKKVESIAEAGVGEESLMPTHISSPTPIDDSQAPAKIIQSDKNENSLDKAISLSEQDLIDCKTVELNHNAEDMNHALQKDQAALALEEHTEDLQIFLQAGQEVDNLVSSRSIGQSFSYSHSPMLSPESPSFVTKAARKSYEVTIEDTSFKSALRTQRKRFLSAEDLTETARENKSSKQVVVDHTIDGKTSVNISKQTGDMSPLRENRLDNENRSYVVRQIQNCVVVIERLKEEKALVDQVKKTRVKDATDDVGEARNITNSSPTPVISMKQQQQILCNNEVGPRSPWKTKAEMKGNALINTEALVAQEPLSMQNESTKSYGTQTAPGMNSQNPPAKRKRHRRNQCELIKTVNDNVDLNSRTRPRRKLEDQLRSENSSEDSRSGSKRYRTRESKTSKVEGFYSPTTTSKTQELKLMIRVPLTALTAEFQKVNFPNSSGIDSSAHVTEQNTGPYECEMGSTESPNESSTSSKDKNFYKSALADSSEAAGALNTPASVRVQIELEATAKKANEANVDEGLGQSVDKESEHIMSDTQQLERFDELGSAQKVQSHDAYVTPIPQSITLSGHNEKFAKEPTIESLNSSKKNAKQHVTKEVPSPEEHVQQRTKELRTSQDYYEQHKRDYLNHQPLTSRRDCLEQPSSRKYNLGEKLQSDTDGLFQSIELPVGSERSDVEHLSTALPSASNNNTYNTAFFKDSSKEYLGPSMNIPTTQAVASETEMLKIKSAEDNLIDSALAGLNSAPDFQIISTNTMDSSTESESSSQEPCASSETSFESSQSSSPLKMNGFLNAFQKYCAESREKEQNNDLSTVGEIVDSPTTGESQALRHMPSLSESNLSEMNDVETTLNGILNEMQDTHIYTPVSSHTDDFFNASVYSPLSDQPETPANSMYADSPISGCISVENSPYMPQKHTPSAPMSAEPDVRRDANHDVFNRFNTYNECFTEDSTQSELIGFQNNIPCFENIELVSANISNSPPAVATASSQEPQKGQYVDNSNLGISGSIEPNNTADNATLQLTQLLNELQQPQQSQVGEIHTDEGNASVTNHEPIITNDFVLRKLAYNQNLSGSQSSMVHNNPHVNTLSNIETSNVVHSNLLSHPQTASVVHSNMLANPQTSNILVNAQSSNVVHSNMLVHPQTNSPKMQYITLSSPPTPQPCLIAQQEPNTNQLNDLQQMATLQAVNIADNGQINLYTSPANQQELQWTTNAGAITAIDAQNNSTTTYYVNANDLYQSNLISTTGTPLDSAQISALLAQQQPQIGLEKRAMDANENYIEGMQNQPIMIVIPHEFLRTADTAQNAQSYVTSNELNTLTVTTQTPQTVLMQSNAINHSNHKPTPHFITASPISSPVGHQQIFTNPPPQQLQQQPPKAKLLYHHQQSSDQKVNLTCRFCHKRPKFTNNLDYSNHIIATHPVETPFNCPHCPLHFTKRIRRQQHILEEHGPRSFQCAQCGENFCAQRTLDLHLQRYHAPEPAQQQQHSAMQQPVRYMTHQQPPPQPQQQQQQQQLQHQRWLDGGHQQQSLVRVEDVHLHVSAEQKGKKYFDDQMTGSDTHTKQETHRQHGQTHSTQVTPAHVTMPSPEQIEPDSTSTTTLRQFRKRGANSPTINSNSGYPASSPTSPTSAANVAAEQLLAEQSLRTSHNCLFCDGRFTNEIALRKHHQMAHSNQATAMPFICKVCNRGFRMNTLLQRHMETHDSEGRPYECSLCHIRFPRPSQLTLHKLTVHFLKKPFTCNDCDKQFANEAMLKTHVKFHGAHMKSHHIPQSAFVEDGTTKITESALTIQQNEGESLEDTLLAEELPEEPFESVDIQVGPMTPTQSMSSDVMQS